MTFPFAPPQALPTLRRWPCAAGVVALALMAGCAGTPPPNEKMAVAEAAVQQANSQGTSDNAAGELQIANGKLTAARQAIATKDYERAGQLAEEAQVDAQVAELHAQSARSRKAALDSQDAARVLNEEINRNSGNTVR